MRTFLHASLLVALVLAGCSGYIAWGDYGYCDPYYDPYCYDYGYGPWYPASLAATDFDADGRLDLAVSDGQNGSLWIVRGTEGGGLEDAPSAHLSFPAPDSAVAVVNADGDPRPDLLVLDASPGTLTTYAGDGAGGFTALATTALTAAFTPGALRFARGHLDGDAIDDIVLLDQGGAVHVALGTGTGGFVDVGMGDPAAAFLGPDVTLRLPGVHLTLGDFDGEAGLDLLVLDGDRATLAVCSGHGDGTFGAPVTAAFASTQPVLGVAAVTLGSGRPADVALLSGARYDPYAQSSIGVVRASDGGVVFEAKPVGTVRAITPYDLNGDGMTDLLLVDAVGHAIRTLHARRP